jgi:hypothetical protein
MDDYAPLLSTSIGTPIHGKVSGVTPKRKIGERKRNKKNGREPLSNKEEDIILDKKLLNNLSRKDDPEKGVEVENHMSEEGEEVLGYGKSLSRTRHRNKVDMTI